MIRFLRRSAGLFLLATVFATGTAAAQRGQFGLEQIDQNANFTRVQLQRLLQVVLTVIGALTWIIRTVIDHRRWIRMSKVQTEAHSKLLDRLTLQLAAYIVRNRSKCLSE